MKSNAAYSRYVANIAIATADNSLAASTKRCGRKTACSHNALHAWSLSEDITTTDPGLSSVDEPNHSLGRMASVDTLFDGTNATVAALPTTSRIGSLIGRIRPSIITWLQRSPSVSRASESCGCQSLESITAQNPNALLFGVPRSRRRNFPEITRARVQTHSGPSRPQVRAPTYTLFKIVTPIIVFHTISRCTGQMAA